MKRRRTDGARIGQVMRQTVRKQIDANDPQEATATYERLRVLGLSEVQIIGQMAAALATEMFDMMKQGREFDAERYEAALRALPEFSADLDQEPS